MTNSTQHPNGVPKPHLGDQSKIQIDAQYYTADEATYERQQLIQYLEHQSRSSGVLSTSHSFDNRKIDYHRQYGLRFSFHNYTNHDVVVIDRLGMPVTIRPERRNSANLGTFVIRREMYFDDEAVCHQTYRNILSLGQLNGHELSKLTPELGREIPGHRFGRNLSIEYIIKQDDIRAADGRMYHLPTDMVVSFLSAAQTIRHPCSPEHVLDWNSFIANFPDGSLDVRVAIRYITNDIRAKPKWVRFGAQVFMLRPECREPAKLVQVAAGKEKQKQDVELATYVELIYPARLDANRSDVSGYRCLRLSLEDAQDQLGVYDTYDDARSPSLVHEREKLQHKNELQAQSSKAVERERVLLEKLEDRESELRKHRTTIEDLRRARDLEIERMREENERAAHRRKLSSENIKLLTVLATATVTLAGLYMKYKASQSSS